MKEIVVNSKVHGAHIFFIDDEDYESVAGLPWYLCNGKHTWYAYRDFPRIRGKGEKKKGIMMHRQILNMEPNNGLIVDHIDGDGHNNTRINMRTCTVTENNRNQVHTIAGTSKYKGVNWSKYHKKWHSGIVVNKKNLYLGRFDNELQAAELYDIAARHYFGEFCSLNFPENDYDPYIPTLRKSGKVQ